MKKLLELYSKLRPWQLLLLITIAAIVFSQALALLITYIAVGKMVPIVQLAALIIPAIAGPLLTLPSAAAISWLNKTKGELQVSEKRFRELAELLPEMICEINPQGFITFANNYAYKQFGYTQEDIKQGLNLMQLFAPESIETVKENLQKRYQGTLEQPNEYMAVSKTGQKFPVLVYSNLIIADGKPVGVRGVMIDITELKRKEEQLVQLNEEVITQNEEIKQANEEVATQNEELNAQNEAYRLLNEDLRKTQKSLKNEVWKNKHIFEFIPSATYIVDKHQKITQWNKQAEIVTGFSKEEMIGEHCNKFALEPCIGKCGLFEKSIEKPIKNRECIIKTKSGKVLFIEKNVDMILDVDRNIIGGIESFRDVTDRKLQQELLKESKEKAEQAAIAKSQFLSTMSHEIRTPMNAVIGMTHLLIQEDPKDEQLDHLKTLKFSAENLLVLINDILDYNKIESGKISFEEADFSLKEVVQGIIQSLTFKSEENNNKILLKLDEKLPEMFVGDAVRLSQVLTNLIANAIKFTENGKITLDIKLEKEYDTKIDLHFAVSDTGIGIEKDKQALIFDRFEQAAADTTRKFGGTGLGLAITKKLLELQDSQIKLESEPGKGSKFYFTLCFKRSTKKAIETKKEISIDDTNALKGVRLLLVEDNTINVFVAKKFLNKWSVEIDEAENGLIAVEKVKENDYDVILMDLQMPEMNGYDATAEIRKLPDEKYKNLPIIALTASVMTEEHKQAFDVGMNDFITKPFNPNELLATILKQLNK